MWSTKKECQCVREGLQAPISPPPSSMLSSSLAPSPFLRRVGAQGRGRLTGQTIPETIRVHALTFQAFALRLNIEEGGAPTCICHKMEARRHIGNVFRFISTRHGPRMQRGHTEFTCPARSSGALRDPRPEVNSVTSGRVLHTAHRPRMRCT